MLGVIFAPAKRPFCQNSTLGKLALRIVNMDRDYRAASVRCEPKAVFIAPKKLRCDRLLVFDAKISAPGIFADCVALLGVRRRRLLGKGKGVVHGSQGKRNHNRERKRNQKKITLASRRVRAPRR